MQSIEVIKGQSLMDIAVEVYGDVTKVFDLVRLNALNGITDRLYPGQKLLVDQITISNQQKVKYIQQYKPIATIKDEDTASGIGFWTIGIDFEVWQEN